MANEPNTPDHRWYERRNNIALSNEDLSRETIFDSGIQKINSWINSQPWGFDYPQLVFDFDDEYFRVDGGDTTFSSAITHTRASTATYVDSTGTLQTAAINEPRLGHHVWNGTAWVNEGLLHESEARTNLITYSEEFDNAAWIKTGTTVLANNTTGPFGGITADRIVENTATSQHTVTQSAAVNYPDNSPYTASIYIKADGRSIFWIESRTKSPTFPQVYFDLANGAVLVENSGASGSIEHVGNGWYHCKLIANALTGASAPNFICGTSLGTSFSSRTYEGDGVSNLLLWGAQLEAAPTPSSYIPTSGSTVTRSADVLTIPAANLPYNSTALSIQMDGTINFADEGLAAQQTFLRWQLDTNNLISVDLDTDSTATGEINLNQASSGVFDTVATSGTALAPSIATAFNIASRHGSTFINGALNGTALTADTTPVALANLSASNLNLGFDYMGTIKTLRLWGQDVGNAGISEASS